MNYVWSDSNERGGIIKEMIYTSPKIVEADFKNDMCVVCVRPYERVYFGLVSKSVRDLRYHSIL